LRCPAISTVHAVLDRHGLVQRRGRRRHRATGTPLALVSAVRAIVRRADAEVPVSDVQTLEQLVEEIWRRPSRSCASSGRADTVNARRP
jgi:hypothetical protein